MVYFIGIGILIVATEYFLLSAGKRDKDWNIHLDKREKVLLGGVNLASCMMLYPFAEKGRAGICLVLLSIVQGCLLTACIMDLKEKMVYRYVWAVGGVIAAGLFCYRGYGELCLGQGYAFFVCGLREYILFVLLQQLLFSKMYGRADCHSFCVCGGVLFSLGGGLGDNIMHMAVTFMLLLIVQVCTGNVTWKGKLREPVPMIPYITAGFWLWVDFNAEKWYI